MIGCPSIWCCCGAAVRVAALTTLYNLLVIVVRIKVSAASVPLCPVSSEVAQSQLPGAPAVSSHEPGALVVASLPAVGRRKTGGGRAAAGQS